MPAEPLTQCVPTTIVLTAPVKSFSVWGPAIQQVADTTAEWGMHYKTLKSYVARWRIMTRNSKTVAIGIQWDLNMGKEIS